MENTYLIRFFTLILCSSLQITAARINAQGARAKGPGSAIIVSISGSKASGPHSYVRATQDGTEIRNGGGDPTIFSNYETGDNFEALSTEGVSEIYLDARRRLFFCEVGKMRITRTSSSKQGLLFILQRLWSQEEPALSTIVLEKGEQCDIDFKNKQSSLSSY